MRSLVLLPLLVVLACGGSSGSTIAGPGGATDGGGTSNDDGGTSGTTYTLDDVCDLTAPKICKLRKSCCEKTFGYDEASCVANAKADCAKDVADVRGGRMTFHPELIEPCLTKFKPVLEACFETIDLLYEAFDIAECRIFQGQLDEGAQCERDSQCKSGPTGSFVDCNDERKTCTYTRLFQAGEQCRYGDSAGGFCAEGLYCDAPLAGSVPGTCKTATPLGSSCDTVQPVSTECGFGAYCDGESGKCTKAKGDGEPCETAFECRSLKCESSGSGSRQCRPADPIVDANECK